MYINILSNVGMMDK